jgi:Transposase DDE domain
VGHEFRQHAGGWWAIPDIAFDPQSDLGTPRSLRKKHGLSTAQAGRARHKCRQRHKKGTPKAKTLYLAGWVLVLTTLAPAVLSAETIMRLYRCRWQVELAIKRWKSVLDVDALRAKARSPLAEVWLHGKLLYALLLERRMRRQ